MSMNILKISHAVVNHQDVELNSKQNIKVSGQHNK